MLVWFRQDLRLADNPALSAALERARNGGGPVIPLFILDETPPQRPLGGAARWWLHHSLTALAEGLAGLGLPLILRRGAAEAVLDRLLAETGAAALFWNRCYEPGAISRDAALKLSLKQRGMAVESFNSALLREPWEVKTGQGRFFQVFTPFWRAAQAGLTVPPCLPVPEPIQQAPLTIDSDRLDDWALLPTKPDWAGGLRATWTPGEAGAQARLERFLAHRLRRYGERRDLPGDEGTSRLSPHLHWGEIGPRQIWHALMHRLGADSGLAAGGEVFARELGWREFSHHLLYHLPQLPTDNLRKEFDAFPWQPDAALLAAWQRGQTGYPIVDAGMRELWHTGWMHNRVRMIVGSLLVKHLLQDWRAGEAWFWDTLVDADLANNVASWQWVAGCGADAAPYFRIFNPVLQGEKFDPDGQYVRRWVPELARLPDRYLHKPWDAPHPVLRDAGITLDTTYPRPVIGLDQGRQRALAAYATIKKEVA